MGWPFKIKDDYNRKYTRDQGNTATYKKGGCSVTIGFPLLGSRREKKAREKRLKHETSAYESDLGIW